MRNLRQNRLNWLRGAALGAGVLLASSAWAADFDVDSFATKLADLRSEVETLSSNVESRKEDERTSLRSLAAQKMDLDLAIQREERRLEQLAAAHTKFKEETALAKVGSTELEPTLKRSIEAMRQEVRDGLPFKSEERLSALDEIEKQLVEGLLPPQKVSARLWQFVEDELRLTRENGIYQQTITLGPEDLLVDVARLGMITIYFRTNDGRVGFAHKTQEGWKWSVVDGPENGIKIAGLFDALKKQVRTGYFELPFAMVGGEK